MKEMLKFIGMLGTPVVAPAVMLRAGEDHMMEISTEFAQGYSADRAKQLLAPGASNTVFPKETISELQKTQSNDLAQICIDCLQILAP
jgi:hypothetical protein